MDRANKYDWLKKFAESEIKKKNIHFQRFGAHVLSQEEFNALNWEDAPSELNWERGMSELEQQGSNGAAPDPQTEGGGQQGQASNDQSANPVQQGTEEPDKKEELRKSIVPEIIHDFALTVNTKREAGKLKIMEIGSIEGAIKELVNRIFDSIYAEYSEGKGE